MRVSDDECEELVARFDRDGDGLVDYSEFLDIAFPRRTRGEGNRGGKGSRTRNAKGPTYDPVVTRMRVLADRAGPAVGRRLRGEFRARAEDKASTRAGRRKKKMGKKKNSDKSHLRLLAVSRHDFIDILRSVGFADSVDDAESAAERWAVGAAAADNGEGEGGDEDSLIADGAVDDVDWVSFLDAAFGAGGKGHAAAHLGSQRGERRGFLSGAFAGIEGRIKRMVLRALHAGGEDEAARLFRRRFDRSGGGLVSEPELRAALREMEIACTEREASLLVRRWDSELLLLHFLQI